MRMLADLAVETGEGRLFLTRNQNLCYRNVPIGMVRRLRRHLADIGLGFEGADAAVDVRACTGSAVCSLAITAAPAAGRAILPVPGLSRNSQLRVHVSGCPNSCAQHQAADIGLSGAKVKINGMVRLGYQVFLGAELAESTLATMAGRVAEEDVPALVDSVVGVWEALRQKGETLAQTMSRVGADVFTAHLTAVAEGWEAGNDDLVSDLVPEPVP
jgi:sulfite reductase beta subunit-like hemoprotein